MPAKSPRADLHQTITDKIVTMLEDPATSGASFPWCRPGVTLSRPTNALTGKRYNGINILSLWCDGHTHNFRSGIWATYKQWQELGAQVRQGEKSSPIVFYKSLEVEDPQAKSEPGDDPATRVIRMAKGYSGFNADQVDGYTLPDLPIRDLTERLAHVEQFVEHCAVPVAYGGASAYYRPSDDRIQMPERVLFETSPTSTATEGLYGVLLHELGHASGAKHRLDRQLSTKFGDQQYAVEELVAELCSAMLCGDLAITPQPRPDHARYIASWLKVLKSDKTAIFAAAAKASQAAQYWHDQQPATVEANHAA
jgi:antirestriction protein ArdC